MRIGREKARVEVSATSANLGPGFDTLGLALEMRDIYELEVTTGPTRVTVHGEGAGEVPTDDSHLVVHAIREALEAAGAPQVGISLTCHNVIPHGRGLGSSSAAIVGGLALGRAILDAPEALSDDDIFALATSIEGHPDNVAPALFGGATLAYMEGMVPKFSALAVGAYSDGRSFLDPVVISPSNAVSTARARTLLPETVPFHSATFNVSRAALFVHALANEPAALMAATADALHQKARSEVMGQSFSLVTMLRSEGIPAVISGAGPTVLVPAGAPRSIASMVRSMVDIPDEWRIARIGVAQEGVRTVLV